MAQWICVLNTGRFGDWKVIEADSEAAALKKLTPAVRRKVAYVQEFKPTRVVLQEMRENPPKRRRRRK